MAENKFTEVNLTINDETLARIRSRFPADTQQGSVTNFIIAHLRDMNAVKIQEVTLRTIASRAGMTQIKSDADLIESITRITKLGENSVVVDIDQNQAPMVQQFATANAMTFGEALGSYIQHFINMGWLNDVFLDLWYCQMSESEFKRINYELGVPKLKDGRHLLELIAGLKGKIASQATEIEHLKNPLVETEATEEAQATA